MIRGAVGAWLGLAALDAVVSNHGAQTTGGVLSFAASVVNRALSPDVALIPDFSKGEGASTDAGTDPTATGQASSDGSSGHNYDLGVTAPAPTPKTSNPNPIPRPGVAVPN